MSPEQAKGQLGLISPRSDIYSLGVVFYELLTGINPFRGENTVDIYQKILTIDPVAPSTLRKGIPKKLSHKVEFRSLAYKIAILQPLNFFSLGSTA